MKVEVNLNNIPVSFILDAGSAATIIGPATWEALCRPKLRKTSVQGRAYPQTSFEFKGTFSPEVLYKAQAISIFSYRSCTYGQ
jgi:hypothetical protein